MLTVVMLDINSFHYLNPDGLLVLVSTHPDDSE